jgi:hypothetical protein
MDLSPVPRLTSFVAGASPQSSDAVRVLVDFLRRARCSCDLRVVDVHRAPAVVHREGVLTVPTVVVTREESRIVVSGALSEPRLRATLGASL